MTEANNNQEMTVVENNQEMPVVENNNHEMTGVQENNHEKVLQDLNSSITDTKLLVEKVMKMRREYFYCLMSIDCHSFEKR